MSYLTLKNLSVFLLVGVMLFPIGINQSYAQSPHLVNVTTPELDFTSPRVAIGVTCLDAAALTLTSTGVTGTLGGLSSTVACFSGEYTWQGFVLNAVGDDDILYSTDAATGTGDMHSISFDELMPETAYRAVLLLTGEYSTSPDDASPTFATATVYRITDFTTPVIPVASDPSIVALQGTSGDLTIPFETFVTPPPDHTFEELTITFGPLGTEFDGLSPTFTGTTSDTPDSTGLLTVDEDEVVITSSLTTNANIVIPYTITERNGLSDSGVITFSFVDYIAPLTAKPYTLDPAIGDLFGLPTIDITIPQSVIRSSLLADTQLASSVPASEITITVASPGDNGGAITVTPASGSEDLTLSYTPTTFGITETFDYTITFRGQTATSQLSIVVPALVCDTAMVVGINFGDVSVDETSGESNLDITQGGNAHVQVMMNGAAWMSGNTAAMNVDVTKWSLIANEPYAAKTALSTTSENVGNKLASAGSVTVYMQLLIDLIDESFRGTASQEFTIGKDCS